MRCRLAGGASSFNYLAKSNALTLPGVDDAEGFRSTLDAMSIVGLSEAEQEAIIQTVAAVLHLGNIIFTDNDRDEAITVDIAADSALRNVSLLLQVSALPFASHVPSDKSQIAKGLPDKYYS